MILSKGTRLGPYEIVAPIEAGGMGSVYKARDTRLSRSVALKVLPVASLQDERLVKRFELEARAAAALTHPNVVAVYDVGEEEVTLPTPFGNETVRLRFLVEEYVEGHSLRKLLRGPRPSLKRIVDIGTGITKGLVAAHEKGLLHRDLKPENILIDLKGNAKIADFGLVRWIYPDTAAPVNDSIGIDPLTRTGFIVGTLGYMSPEQAKGETLGAPSDLFVFGILLYEMITGQAPFARDDVDEVFKAILRESPTPVLDIAPGAPPRLAAIVDRLLAKTTAQRYRSASEVLSDFDRLAEEIRRRGSGSGERPQDPISLAPGVSARRETPPLVFLVTAVAVMVAFAGGLAVATARARSRPALPRESLPGGWEAPSRWHASLVTPAPALAGGTLLDVLPLASGDLVATIASGDGSDLFLVSAAGGSGDLVCISSPDSGGRAPAVSADGTRIVFSGGRDGHRGGLHEAALSTLATGSRPLLGEGEEPALSPDGAALAYVVRSADRTELFLASADGEKPRRLHEAPSRELHFPAFSSDGRGLVVLETAREPEASGAGSAGAGSAGAATNAVLLWIPLPGPGPAIPLSTERFAVARPSPLASGEFLLRTAGTSAGLIVPREGASRRAPFGAALSLLAASPDASRVATRGEGGPLVVWTAGAK